MKEILSMVLVLSVICGVSGFSLAALKGMTKDRIESQVLTYVQGPALMDVVGVHDNNPIAERINVPAEGGDLTIFPVKQKGKLTGFALETFAPGYSGDIGVMVGFSTESSALLGIGITTQTETPGLGSRVTLPAFTSQFRGHAMSRLDLGAGVEGVSGASYSSKGAVEAVKKAMQVYAKNKSQILTALNK